MKRNNAIIEYIDRQFWKFQMIKVPSNERELILIREIIAKMQGILISHIGNKRATIIIEKAEYLQEMCYKAWHEYNKGRK